MAAKKEQLLLCLSSTLYKLRQGYLIMPDMITYSVSTQPGLTSSKAFKQMYSEASARFSGD